VAAVVEETAAPAVSYLVISRWVDKLKKKKSPFSHSKTRTSRQRYTEGRRRRTCNNIDEPVCFCCFSYRAKKKKGM